MRPRFVAHLCLGMTARFQIPDILVPQQTIAMMKGSIDYDLSRTTTFGTSKA